MSRTSDAVVAAARTLVEALKPLRFADPVTHVYQPLEYAAALHEQYIHRFATGPRRVLFLGMNPGPFGMSQTGVPFGEISAVRDWMRLDAAVRAPERVHPKRPIEGLACTRSEVSGRRLYGLFAERYPVAKDFFKEHFIINWCPLAFMEASGRNLTPDKLPKAEREAIEGPCDAHLAELVRILKPSFLIGVGGFAAKRAQRVLAAHDLEVKVGTVLHPSPASPAANRGWEPQALKALVDQGIWQA